MAGKPQNIHERGDIVPFWSTLIRKTGRSLILSTLIWKTGQLSSLGPCLQWHLVDTMTALPPRPVVARTSVPPYSSGVNHICGMYVQYSYSINMVSGPNRRFIINYYNINEYVTGFVLSMEYLEKNGIQLSVFKVMKSMKFRVTVWKSMDFGEFCWDFFSRC